MTDTPIYITLYISIYMHTVVMLQNSMFLESREMYMVCPLQLVVVVYRAPHNAVPFTPHIHTYIHTQYVT